MPCAIYKAAIRAVHAPLGLCRFLYDLLLVSVNIVSSVVPLKRIIFFRKFVGVISIIPDPSISFSGWRSSHNALSEYSSSNSLKQPAAIWIDSRACG